jgi:enamine deaminase RidA (YjgF/YER057c/UK114 family)
MINSVFKLMLACIFLASAGNAFAQSSPKSVESRLTEMGITLTPPQPMRGSLLTAITVGNLVYLSGHGPDKPSGGQITGKIGRDLTVEQGTEAARLTGISLLNSLKREIGDLNRVKRIIKVLGLVNATDTFTQHPQVINGFSNFMVEVFGDSGKHTRSAIGVSSLPSNIAVEIEMIVELHP